MTRYEELKNKADACRKAARNVSGYMRQVWINKANELETMAGNLPLNKACEVIK